MAIEPKFSHREFRDDEFWREIPGWKGVSKEVFNDWKWQAKNSIIKLSQVQEVLGSRVEQSLIDDIAEGQKVTPMNIRITPYVFSLIDWDNPVSDPLRKQFLPIKSQFKPDHPYFMIDSLAEDTDSPVSLLTHRYQDKVLFLPLTTCPVYCSYCTRSRIIGGSTDSKEKATYGANEKKWEPAFDYIRKHPQIEDVVISGGDAFNLQPAQISLIGKTLLEIPHIRRIRYATKGIAIFPMKILTDDAWVNAIIEVERLGHSLGKEVVIHTHFSSPQEITTWSKKAMERLFAKRITVRNQAVLQQGVNDKPEIMGLLIKQLSYINVQPYYVYLHDMVPGCEHFRTTLNEAVQLEKHIRGITAGFNTPRFICDLPQGGGKRNISSFEYYDQEFGISVWTAPEVKPGEVFVYFDPIHKLPEESQKIWLDPEKRKQIVRQAITKGILHEAKNKTYSKHLVIKTKSLEERFGISFE